VSSSPESPSRSGSSTHNRRSLTAGPAPRQRRMAMRNALQGHRHRHRILATRRCPRIGARIVQDNIEGSPDQASAPPVRPETVSLHVCSSCVAAGDGSGGHGVGTTQNPPLQMNFRWSQRGGDSCYMQHGQRMEIEKGVCACVSLLLFLDAPFGLTYWARL
jgi:hypothetical protein